MSYTILVIDDEANTRRGLKKMLNAKGYEILLASNGVEGLQKIKELSIDLVLTDLRMPDLDGLSLTREIQKLKNAPLVIVLTAYGSIPTAVEAMKSGAYDYLSKPVNLDELELLVERALKSKKIEMENVSLKQQLDHKFGVEQIIGNSIEIQRVIDMIRQISQTKATVLIEGESGTGKELVAHAIHHNSERKVGPFVAVNCAALSENLLESELFGHEKGAFTGAHEMRKGRFEFADNGTLFLDEISEMSLSLQAKLLRVLQDRTFQRVGGSQTSKVDVRVLLATNRNLEIMVKENKFRGDLFYRINVVKIMVPPLRNRCSDIPLLIESFIKELGKEHKRIVKSINPEVVEIFKNYDWPGNIRELRNTLESMIVLSKDGHLDIHDIPANIRFEKINSVTNNLENTAYSLKELEKAKILKTLEESHNNKTKAAQILGISRRTLHRKLNEYNLNEV